MLSFSDFSFYCLPLAVLFGFAVCSFLKNKKFICVAKIRKKSKPTAAELLVNIEYLQKHLDTVYLCYGRLCSSPFNLKNPAKNTLWVQNNMQKNQKEFLRIKKELTLAAQKTEMLFYHANLYLYKKRLPAVYQIPTGSLEKRTVPDYRKWADYVEKEQNDIFRGYICLCENLSLLRKSLLRGD